MLEYCTAGESHGKGLVTIITGLPAGLQVDTGDINHQLAQRQKGYGRGGRMSIEQDRIEILSGVRGKKTIGSPVSFFIVNKDYPNWSNVMDAEHNTPGERAVQRPRPGHADLPGAIKYHHRDMRNILERASARETASRVAAGAFFSQLLACFDMVLYSQVVSIGSIACLPVTPDKKSRKDLVQSIEASPLRCADSQKTREMMDLIDGAKARGESLGGSFEVAALGVPPGLGSHISWDRRLDALLAGLIMSIPAIKGVEIGPGIDNSTRPGSEVHDEIFYTPELGLYRKTNRAGGIEGGISNGETITVRAFMKPIPTLYKPLTSVNTSTWEEEKADIERSDICAVAPASLVGEAMLAYGIARAFMEKFSGDHIDEIQRNYCTYRDYMKKVWKWEKT